jgi:regulatory protein
MHVITALEMQKRNKERVNVYLDGDYAFSLTLIEAAQLHKGQQLTTEQIEELRNQDAINKAVDHAARFLSYRPRSIEEVRQNLAGKDYPQSTIMAAISKLERLGYLDDNAFARYWLENRDRFKPRGKMALRQELRQKGVDNQAIETVLETYDEDNAAYRAAEQKARRFAGLTRSAFRKKLGAYLQRRGFNYGMSRDAIAQVEDELAEADPQFFAEEDA